MTEAAKELISTASCIGSRVSLDLLSSVSGMSLDEVAEQTISLCNAGLIFQNNVSMT